MHPTSSPLHPAQPGSGLPPGTVLPYAGINTPQGFLPCDGRLFHVLDYPALFSAIGTTYGSGDQGREFRLPDMRCRFPLGCLPTPADPSSPAIPPGSGGLTQRALGATGGEEQHHLTMQEMPAHSHTPVGADLGCIGGGARVWLVGGQYINNGAKYGTGTSGEDHPHNTMPPFLGLNFIIKV